MIEKIRAALARVFAVRDTGGDRESDVTDDPHVAGSRATTGERGDYVGRAGADTGADTGEAGRSGAEARADRPEPERS